MADFLIAHKAVMNIEGGYANDAADSGGETMYGIARNSWPKWSGWVRVDDIKRRYGRAASTINLHAKQDPILQQLVLSFYENNFWDEMNLDILQDQSVATELYDIGVNMSTGQAGVYFQKILNAMNVSRIGDLVIDGAIGAKTLAAFHKLNASDRKLVWRYLNSLQGERYIELGLLYPKNRRFVRGWGYRVYNQ